MTDLPRGTVTFLFTDIEGSTERWERDRQAMATAVEHHVALLRTAIEAMAGCYSRPYGDAVPAAFPTTSDTVVAATAHPRAAPLNWPYRGCPPQGPFLLRHRSAGHPRGALQRGLAPHPSPAGASKPTMCSPATRRRSASVATPPRRRLGTPAAARVRLGRLQPTHSRAAGPQSHGAESGPGPSWYTRSCSIASGACARYPGSSVRPRRPINHTHHPPFPSLSPPFAWQLLPTRAVLAC